MYKGVKELFCSLIFFKYIYNINKDFNYKIINKKNSIYKFKI